MRLSDVTAYDALTARMVSACDRAMHSATKEEAFYWEREADRLDNSRQALRREVLK